MTRIRTYKLSDHPHLVKLRKKQARYEQFLEKKARGELADARPFIIERLTPNSNA